MKNPAAILCLFALIALTPLTAQTVHSFYSSGDSLAPAMFSDCQTSSDKHYYCGEVGSTFRSIYVSEVNAAGTLIWQRIAPDLTCSESASEMAADNASIYVVGLSIDTLNNMTRGLIVRFRPDGTVQWRIRIGSSRLQAIECLPDGGLVAAGGTTVVCMDSTGVVRWMRQDICAALPQFNYSDVMIDSAGAVYCVGSAYSASVIPQAVMTKSDSNGVLLWSRQYGNLSNPNGIYCGLIRDSLIYLAGRSLWPSPNGYTDALLLMRTDTAGNLLYKRMTALSAEQSFTVHELAFTPYNTLITGGSFVSPNNRGPFLAELSLDSFSFMRAMYYETPNAFMSDLTIDSAGRTFYCGDSFSNTVFDSYYGVIDYSWPVGCGLVPLNFTMQNHSVAGSPLSITSSPLTSALNYGYDYPATINWNVCIDNVSVPENAEHSDIRLYPNPASSLLQIESARATSIVICNAQGAIVWQDNSSNSNIRTVDVSSWATGLYFVMDDSGITQRFTVIRE